jgi:hypothetical protein
VSSRIVEQERPQMLGHENVLKLRLFVFDERLQE